MWPVGTLLLLSEVVILKHVTHTQLLEGDGRGWGMKGAV